MNVAIALLIGFALDLLFGDPRWLPHPVVAIGRCISLCEKVFRRLFPATPSGELAGGAATVGVVGSLSFLAPWAVLHFSARWDHRAALVLECLMCYQILATKGLRDASMRVYWPLTEGDVAAARRALSHIVGRDTAQLDAAGATRAAVETVAENASDGVVAPMLFFAIGGAPLAFLYKAVNTMDSMLGYRNERYLYFGRFAARLDDIVNYVPARVSACLLIVAAALCGDDWRAAAKIYRRDRRNHTSPNSAHPEAAAAGALGVRLGGDSLYGGRLVSKPTIGDAVRPVEPADIGRVNRLLYVAALLCLIACCAARLGVLSLIDKACS